MATETSNARGDVRGLVAQWQECSCGFSDPRGGYESCPECGAALAAEGVQAGEVEQRARELLAAECGVSPTAFNDALPNATVSESIAIRAIASALSQPEARGVVDGAKLKPCPTCGAPCEYDVKMRGGDYGWSTTDEQRTFYRFNAAALTGERNV